MINSSSTLSITQCKGIGLPRFLRLSVVSVRPLIRAQIKKQTLEGAKVIHIFLAGKLGQRVCSSILFYSSFPYTILGSNPAFPSAHMRKSSSPFRITISITCKSPPKLLISQLYNARLRCKFHDLIPSVILCSAIDPCCKLANENKYGNLASKALFSHQVSLQNMMRCPFHTVNTILSLINLYCTYDTFP